MGILEIGSNGSRPKTQAAAGLVRRPTGADYCQSIFAHLNGSKALLRTLGVTSCRGREGVSSVASGLANAAAAEGKKVLLVDANPDRAALHRAYRSKDRPGLCDILAERASLQEAIQRVGKSSLSLLPAGRPGPRLLWQADEALCSRLLEAVRTGFDVLVWDLPPVNRPAFPGHLAALLDGVVWVMTAGRVSAAAAAEAKQRMESLHLHLLGIVLNRASRCRPANGFTRR